MGDYESMDDTDRYRPRSKSIGAQSRGTFGSGPGVGRNPAETQQSHVPAHGSARGASSSSWCPTGWCPTGCCSNNTCCNFNSGGSGGFGSVDMGGTCTTLAIGVAATLFVQAALQNPSATMGALTRATNAARHMASGDLMLALGAATGTATGPDADETAITDLNALQYDQAHREANAGAGADETDDPGTLCNWFGLGCRTTNDEAPEEKQDSPAADDTRSPPADRRPPRQNVVYQRSAAPFIATATGYTMSRLK